LQRELKIPTLEDSEADAGLECHQITRAGIGSTMRREFRQRTIEDDDADVFDREELSARSVLPGDAPFALAQQARGAVRLSRLLRCPAGPTDLRSAR